MCTPSLDAQDFAIATSRQTNADSAGAEYQARSAGSITLHASAVRRVSRPPAPPSARVLIAARSIGVHLAREAESNLNVFSWMTTALRSSHARSTGRPHRTVCASDAPA